MGNAHPPRSRVDGGLYKLASRCSSGATASRKESDQSGWYLRPGCRTPEERTPQAMVLG